MIETQINNCPHSRIQPTISVTTSVIAIQIMMFGFKCLDCNEQWDIGDVGESFFKIAQLEAENEKMRIIILACPECERTLKGLYYRVTEKPSEVIE